MRRYVWLDFKAHWRKYLMTLLAVALGTAFLSGTLTFNRILSDTMTALINSGTHGDAFVSAPSISGDDSGLKNVPRPVTWDELDAIKAIDGVKSAEPQLYLVATLLDQDNETIGSNPTVAIQNARPDAKYVTGSAPKAPTQPLDATTTTTGANATTESTTSDGAASEKSSTIGEISAEKSFAQTNDLHTGDRIYAIIGGQKYAYQLSGLFDYGVPLLGTGMLQLPGEVMRQMATTPEGFTAEIAVSAKPGVEPNRLVQNLKTGLKGAFPNDYKRWKVKSAADYAAEQSDLIAPVLGFVSNILLVFVCVALFISTFIVSNTFTATVRSQTRQLAMMRAVGAKPRQIFAIILGEGFVAGLIGSLLGAVLGWGLVALIMQILRLRGMNFLTSGIVSGSTLALTVLAGLAVVLVSVLRPARRAAATPPVQAMSTALSGGDLRWGWRLLVVIITISLGLSAAICAVNSVFTTTQKGRSMLYGGGVFFVVVGILAAAPLLVSAFAALLGRLAKHLWRPVGELAVGNLGRNPKRTATTAGALLIGIMLVAAGSSLVTSLQASFTKTAGAELTASFLIQPSLALAGHSIPDELVSSWENTPGVTAVQTFAQAPLTLQTNDKTTGKPGDSHNVTVTALPDTKPGVTLKTVAGRAVSAPGKLLVEDKTARKLGLKLGDSATLTPLTSTTSERETLKVGGLFSASNLVDATLVVHPQDLESLHPAGQIANTGVIFTNRTDLKALGDNLKSQVAAIAPGTVTVASRADLNTQLNKSFDMILAIIYGLLALSLIIALVGIMNTLAMSVGERLSEIGMLKALGLSGPKMVAMIVGEALLTAIFALVVGILTGLGATFGLQRIMAARGISSMVVSSEHLLILVLLTLVATVLASLGPALRAVRTPTLAAIATTD